MASSLSLPSTWGSASTRLAVWAAIGHEYIALICFASTRMSASELRAANSRFRENDIYIIYSHAHHY